MIIMLNGPVIAISKQVEAQTLIPGQFSLSAPNPTSGAAFVAGRRPPLFSSMNPANHC
jgi:hypothetical protein